MPRRRSTEGSPARGEEVVAFDNLGAGPGGLIGLSEGREAANPFGKDKTPVDAYCACLIDQITSESLTRLQEYGAMAYGGRQWQDRA